MIPIKYKNPSDILRKPVGSIYIDSNNITLLGRKTFNIFLKNAGDKIKTNATHSMSLDDFRLSIDSSSNTTHLRKILKTLTTTAIEWNCINRDKKKEWGVTALIAGAKIADNIVTYSFSEDLKELLADTSKYAKIDMRLQNVFDSKHALILYEMVVDFYREKDCKGETPRISIPDFKIIMGVSSTKSYKIFSNLRRFVINTGINEINKKTEFFVNYELGKNGKTYEWIKFTITKNDVIEVSPTHLKQSSENLEIPSELLALIPKNQYEGPRGCRQICLEILKKQGVEALDFYIRQTKKIDQKKPRDSWGKTIRSALQRNDFETHKNEMKTRKAAQIQKADADIKTMQSKPIADLRKLSVAGNSLAVQVLKEKKTEQNLAEQADNTLISSSQLETIKNMTEAQLADLDKFIGEQNLTNLLRERFKKGKMMTLRTLYVEKFFENL
jgi:hypothetical protein